MFLPDDIDVFPHHHDVKSAVTVSVSTDTLGKKWHWIPPR